MICISIAHINQVRKINALQPDMIELRLDLIKEEPSAIMKILNEGPKIIATCRPGNISDQERMDLLKEMVDRHVSFVDIEIDADPKFRKEIVEYAQNKQTEVILSWHDFEKTPGHAQLVEIIKRSYAMGADIAKIACMVNDLEDNANLLALYNMEGRKVVLGMGYKGKITRLAALKLGAEFTFVSLDEQHATAPGQLTLSEFQTLNKILQSS